MAIRYIAVDSGKFATKVAEYDPKKKCVRTFSIRTKVSDGDFRDDAIEANTVIVGLDGEVYKVGNGARGAGVELETTKRSDVHKLCTLTAIATVASSNETDEINVAVGLPAKEWASVSKRMDYKEYILPDGEITVSIKKNNVSPEIKKTFIIKKKFVYPESIGALFMDETIGSINTKSVTGVLDIGNLNLNATLWQGTELLQDKSTTADLGGAILIQELAQEISTNITTCDELIAANILKDKEKNLPSSVNLSAEQIEESKKLIKRVLKTHADRVKRCCQGRNWSLNLTKIVAIGGTSSDISKELTEVFGNIIILPEHESTFCNALGYLRMMCANFPELGNEQIPLLDEKHLKVAASN